MAITVANNRPVVLDPVHTAALSGLHDPVAVLREVITDPLLTPASSSAVTVVDDAGQDVTRDVPDMLLNCLRSTVDTDAEQETKALLGQTMTHYDADTILPVAELFALQSGIQRSLPEPIPPSVSGRSVIYTAGDDVLPAAKALVDGRSGAADEFFASLAYAYHPRTLGFAFRDETEFEAFKVWMGPRVQRMGTLPGNTSTLLGKLADLPLKGLTQSLLLRTDSGDGNWENSFPRVLIRLLMEYVRSRRTKDPDAVGVLPFSLDELVCPTSLVLVDVRAHAEATPTRISAEWKIINKALATPVRVISHQHLTKLDAIPRAAAREQANVAAGRSARDRAAAKAASITLRRRAPRTVDLFGDTCRALRRMGEVSQSQNTLRTSRPSYLRASRRDPRDINRPGRIVSTRYLPDIHIYLDHSISISQDQYQDEIILLINLAKKMDVNLYFSSFSHVLSQETMLQVKGRSVADIWQSFQRIPKVSGNTDFQQIWQHINASPVRLRRFNLMITDFMWYPPSTREDHPHSLFYAPCSLEDWEEVREYAAEFVAGMRHIDPAINQRLLGMVG